MTATSPPPTRRALAAPGLILALAAATVALAGCGHHATGPTLQRAIITTAHVREAIEFEKRLAATADALAPEGQPWFTVEAGRSRVVVVAGHATQPTRNGKLRFRDTGTGSVAHMLHRLAGATAVYTTHASPSDPNYYDDNEFKRALARLIAQRGPALVIDLHASHGYRPYEADMGTMGGQSLLGSRRYLDLLAEALRREGLTNLSKDYFAASKSQTITKWVSARGVPCIQLEVSATRLLPDSSDLHGHRYAQLLQALVRFIRGVDKPGCGN